MIYRRDKLTQSQAAAADIITDAAEATGINAAFMLALGVTESSLRPAITGDDGISFGLFQLQVQTAKRFEPALNGDDLLDATVNTRVAMDYAQELFSQYTGHTWGDYAEAWTLGGHGRFDLGRRNPRKVLAMKNAIAFLDLPLDLNGRSII